MARILEINPSTHGIKKKICPGWILKFILLIILLLYHPQDVNASGPKAECKVNPMLGYNHYECVGSNNEYTYTVKIIDKTNSKGYEFTQSRNDPKPIDIEFQLDVKNPSLGSLDNVAFGFAWEEGIANWKLTDDPKDRILDYQYYRWKIQTYEVHLGKILQGKIDPDSEVDFSFTITDSDSLTPYPTPIFHECDFDLISNNQNQQIYTPNSSLYIVNGNYKDSDYQKSIKDKQQIDTRITKNGSDITTGKAVFYTSKNTFEWSIGIPLQISNNFSVDDDPYTVEVNEIGNRYFTPACAKTFWITKDGIQPTLVNTPTPTPIDPAYCSDPNQCLIDHCSIPFPTHTPDCSVCAKLCKIRPTLKPLKLQKICETLEGKKYDENNECAQCLEGITLQKTLKTNDKVYGMWTAIGCVPVDFSLLLRDYVFPYGIGIGGGIAFLFFIYGTFLILTSAGNAEQVEQGKQTIVSALSGLILIIFSVLFLKIIGVDILRLPGFG